MGKTPRHIVKYYNHQSKRIIFKTVFFIDDFFGWGDDEGQFLTEESAKGKIKKEFGQNHTPKVFDKSYGLK